VKVASISRSLLAPHTQDLGAADVAVYGVPFDAGTSLIFDGF
jgi:hypothetical protein